VHVLQRDEITKQVVSQIVITHYNRKTYRIDEIDYEATPSALFTTRTKDGQEKSTSYREYYSKRYGIEIPDSEMDQPLLVSYPRRKDVNKGMKTNIYLLPSLCNLTGLSDEQRKDFRLMQRLSTHLHMDPVNRKKKLDEFMDRLRSDPEVRR